MSKVQKVTNKNSNGNTTFSNKNKYKIKYIIVGPDEGIDMKEVLYKHS